MLKIKYKKITWTIQNFLQIQKAKRDSQQTEHETSSSLLVWKSWAKILAYFSILGHSDFTYFETFGILAKSLA